MESIKVYVPVLAAFAADGKMIPRRIRWEDGEALIAQSRIAGE